MCLSPHITINLFSNATWQLGPQLLLHMCGRLHDAEEEKVTMKGKDRWREADSWNMFTRPCSVGVFIPCGCVCVNSIFLSFLGGKNETIQESPKTEMFNTHWVLLWNWNDLYCVFCGYIFISVFVCVVVQGGAGCADPGAGEEGGQLVQPMGSEAAGWFHGLTWLPRRSARLPF